MQIINKEVELYRKFSEGRNRPKLKNMFKLLNINPNPFQEAVIDYYDNKYKEWHTLFLMASRRSGKSTVVSLIAALELLKPNAGVALVAPTNKQTEIIFNEVLNILRKLNLKPIKINSNEKSFKMENGSFFKASSEKTATQLEGYSYSLLLVDEVYLLNDIEPIIASLSPAMSTFGVYEDTKIPVAKTILLGSVKPNKQIIELANKGLRKEKGFVTLKFTAYDNPLLSKEFLEAEKEKLGEAKFKQEYLCEPAFLDGQLVFNAFEYSKNVIDMEFIKRNIDDNSTIITGLDIGATDKSAFVMVYNEGGKYYVFDGFEISNSSEKIIANKIKEYLKKYNLEYLPDYSYIDPSAKLTRIGLANDYELTFYPAKNAIRESVHMLNDLFREQKLFIDKSLTYLIQQIQEIEWKNNSISQSDPFKRVKGHHFDSIAALRYAIYTFNSLYKE